jgi:hypothetical protein
VVPRAAKLVSRAGGDGDEGDDEVMHAAYGNRAAFMSPKLRFLAKVRIDRD